MRTLIFYFFLLLTSIASAQRPFTGKLVYSVEIADTSLRQLFPPSLMTIYTNDTILRVETHTDQLGKQVLIQHLQKNKGYLLIETAAGNYAIQVPEKENSGEEKYTFSHVKGKKVICGLKSKKLAVSTTGIKQPLEYYYHKAIPARYVPGFEHFPGLLTDYYVLTKDGLYHHQLKEISTQAVSKDLFGIPSDYRKISMSDFVDIMTGGDKTIDN